MRRRGGDWAGCGSCAGLSPHKKFQSKEQLNPSSALPQKFSFNALKAKADSSTHHPQTRPQRAESTLWGSRKTFGAPFAQNDIAILLRISGTQYYLAEAGERPRLSSTVSGSTVVRSGALHCRQSATATAASVTTANDRRARGC